MGTKMVLEAEVNIGRVGSFNVSPIKNLGPNIGK